MTYRTLLFASLLFPGLGLFGQDPTQTQNDIEKAHESLIRQQAPKSAIAGALTADLAASLPKEGSTLQETVIHNYIDQFIFERMRRDRIPHAPLSSDPEFARRVWLDATGRIPTPDELQTFLADKRPNKRDELIDRLTTSDAFVDRWTFYFQDLFRAGSRMGSGLKLLRFWIREWLNIDRPYNEVVTDLLTQSAKTSFSAPGAMYFGREYIKAKDDPTTPEAEDLVDQGDTIDEFTVTYSKVFLGLNMACISCHDGARHLENVNLFLSRKKRADFFNQAAFFGKTREIMNWENGIQTPTEFTIDDKGPGYDPKAVSLVRVPRRGVDQVSPHFILTGEAPGSNSNLRDELARMITGNIQFGRAFTNRIWSELMGFGIVEPVDEFDLARYDPSNPPPAPWGIQPSNPELLDAMARDFAGHQYSFRHFLRTVMKSSAYQLSSSFAGEWKPEYAQYYSRKYVRMLSAAELHDEIVLATAKPGEPIAADAQDGIVMQMPEPGKAAGDVKNFLRVFGQSSREDLPKKTPQSALQAMLLMQSRLVNERVAAKGGTRVDQLLKEPIDDNTLVRKLYLATVSREPSTPEMTTALKALTANRSRGAQDLQWALINSPEFIFNY
jgi:hypothetical protein